MEFPAASAEKAGPVDLRGLAAGRFHA